MVEHRILEIARFGLKSQPFHLPSLNHFTSKMMIIKGPASEAVLRIKWNIAYVYQSTRLLASLQEMLKKKKKQKKIIFLSQTSRPFPCLQDTSFCLASQVFQNLSAVTLAALPPTSFPQTTLYFRQTLFTLFLPFRVLDFPLYWSELNPVIQHLSKYLGNI